MFGTEMLLDIAKSTLGKRLIVSQGTISVLCGGIADGRIKVLQAPCSHALRTALKPPFNEKL